MLMMLTLTAFMSTSGSVEKERWRMNTKIRNFILRSFIHARNGAKIVWNTRTFLSLCLCGNQQSDKQQSPNGIVITNNTEQIKWFIGQQKQSLKNQENTHIGHNNIYYIFVMNLQLFLLFTAPDESVLFPKTLPILFPHGEWNTWSHRLSCQISPSWASFHKWNHSERNRELWRLPKPFQYILISNLCLLSPHPFSDASQASLSPHLPHSQGDHSQSRRDEWTHSE